MNMIDGFHKYPTTNMSRSLLLGGYSLFVGILVTIGVGTFFASGGDADGLTYTLSLMTIGTLAAIFACWVSITRSFFDPFTLFLLSLLLFLSGHQLLEVFGLASEVKGVLNSRFPPLVVNTSLLMVLISFASFGFGGIGGALSSARSVKASASPRDVQREQHAIRLVGWVMLAVALIPQFLSFRHQLGSVALGGYAAIYNPANAGGGFEAIFRIIGGFYVPGAIFLIAGNDRRRLPVVVGLVAVSLYALANFAVGTRGNAIMPLLAVAWVWHRRVGRLPALPSMAAGLVMLFVVFPVLHAVRGKSLGDRSGISAFIEAFQGIDNPMISIIDEMGKSLRIVAWTHELVPNMRPFDFGLSYLIAGTAMVPNLLGGQHFATVHQLSTWLTVAVNPTWAAVGGGYGFSYLGEAYLNFGWYGVVLVSLFLGWGLSSLVVKTGFQSSPKSIALLGCITSIIVFYPRAELQQIIRDLAWYSVIPFLAVNFIQAYGGRFGLMKS